MKEKLVVFASGTKEGGGSGFENLATSKDFEGEVIGVISNHEHGGVRKRAERLGIPFVHLPGPFDAAHYRAVVEGLGGEWVALSGWLKRVVGLDPARTFNIHPALLSHDNGRFGGGGMYGHHIHAAVAKELERGNVTEAGLSMHFVTDEYDRGPVFFEYRVPLRRGMTAEEIGTAMNKAEHAWQPKITHMVTKGEIRWDGTDPQSLVVPKEYKYLPK